MTDPDVTIVVPVYNSESTIQRLVEELKDELSPKCSYEVVLVNDGSTDKSYEVCRQMAMRDSNIKFISLFKNFGQTNAIMAGLREANGEIIVVMDDDLQNPPSEIHKLLDAIHRGYDFVFGAPIGKAQQTLGRRLGSYVNFKMAEIVFKKPRGLYPSSYYAIRKSVVREVVKYDGPFPYISGFMFRVTNNGCNVSVQHNPRAHGKSGYGLRKLILLWLSGFTNFSILPLRLSTFMGAVSAIAGFAFLLFIVVRKLLMPDVILSGWTSVVGIVLAFAGIQLLALGMLGEYVGRIFLIINRNPQYTIREKYNCRLPD
jgi:undecaprenyl-phosphate 4-deoxy-4-formamido-L-arabinose transferase